MPLTTTSNLSESRTILNEFLYYFTLNKLKCACVLAVNMKQVTASDEYCSTTIYYISIRLNVCAIRTQPFVRVNSYFYFHAVCREHIQFVVCFPYYSLLRVSKMMAKSIGILLFLICFHFIGGTSLLSKSQCAFSVWFCRINI